LIIEALIRYLVRTVLKEVFLECYGKYNSSHTSGASFKTVLTRYLINASIIKANREKVRSKSLDIFKAKQVDRSVLADGEMLLQEVTSLLSPKAVEVFQSFVNPPAPVVELAKKKGTVSQTIVATHLGISKSACTKYVQEIRGILGEMGVIPEGFKGKNKEVKVMGEEEKKEEQQEEKKPPCFGEEFDPNEEDCIERCRIANECKEVMESKEEGKEEGETESPEEGGEEDSEEDGSSTAKPPEEDVPPDESASESGDGEKQEEKEEGSGGEGSATDTPGGEEEKEEGGDTSENGKRKSPAKNEFGFRLGTQGAFISEIMNEGPQSVTDLGKRVVDKYGTNLETAKMRVRRVINDLKKMKVKVVYLEGRYEITGKQGEEQEQVES
jgi:predicted transcriptional regulator